MQARLFSSSSNNTERDKYKVLLKRIPDLDGFWDKLESGYREGSNGMSEEDHNMLGELIAEERQRRQATPLVWDRLKAQLKAELDNIEGLKDDHNQAMVNEMVAGLMQKLELPDVKTDPVAFGLAIINSVKAAFINHTEGTFKEEGSFQNTLIVKLGEIIKKAVLENAKQELQEDDNMRPKL
jgi:hypothetical protein